MSFSRPIQWYHFHEDPIWPDGTRHILDVCTSTVHHRGQRLEHWSLIGVLRLALLSWARGHRLEYWPWSVFYVLPSSAGRSGGGHDLDCDGSCWMRAVSAALEGVGCEVLSTPAASEYVAFALNLSTVQYLLKPLLGRAALVPKDKNLSETEGVCSYWYSFWHLLSKKSRNVYIL